MKTRILYISLLFCLVLLGNNTFAQAPNISYTPSSNTLTLGTAFSLSPTNTPPGGAVTGFSFGTAIPFISGPTLNNPIGMGIDPSGNIYVVNYNASDYSNSFVSKYNSTGAYQGTFGSTPNLQQPTGITFDAAGNGYVLNYNRTNNGNGNNHGNAYVDEYNSSGVYQSTLVQGLGTANGIAMDASNNFYVAQGSYNGGANTASQYNNLGAIAFSIATGHTVNPVGVAVDGSYNIFVLDNTNGNVTKYNSTGAYLSTPITGLTNAHAIFIDGAGDIYVGNTGATAGTGYVKVYDLTGTLLATLSGLTDPEGLVADSQGNLYVSDYTLGTVTKYPRTGGYFISGVLPPGLTFNITNGTISGTPTTPFAMTTYTVTAFNTIGHSSTPVTLYCPANPMAPIISYDPFSVNVYTTGTAITNLVPTVSPSGGTPTNYTISPALPANTLTFSTATGIFSGTPAVGAISPATVYTITAFNGTLSGTTTVSIAFVKDNYWTGKQDSKWENKQNWSAKTLPGTGGYDLASIGVINYAPNPDPIITSTTGAVSIKYVTFGAANAATLTVQSGGSLTVNNILTINNNATPTVTETVGTTGAINIAPAAVVNVAGTGTLTINSPLTFTLQSNATSSASVAAMTTGLISGNVTVQRYIPAGYRGYMLLSSPVNTGTTDANNNTIYSINYLLNSTYVSGTSFPNSHNTLGGSKPGNPSLYLYREDLAPVNTSFTGGNFRGISDLSLSPSYTLDGDGAGFHIPVGNGYLMFFRSGPTAADPYLTTATPLAATLSATGKLNQGAITFTHWNTPATPGLMFTTASGDPTIEGFNLIGNPYACTIDLSSYATGGISLTNISTFIYEFDPTSKNYGIYTLGGGTLPTNHASQYIVSGQGFFVQASSASPTALLTFNESAKVENIQNTGVNLLLSTQPVATNNVQYLRMRMAMDTINIDETIIRFNSNAKSTYTFNEDAPYRAGSGKVSMSSLSSDNKALGINTLALPKQGQTRISLNVGATADGIYTLNLMDIKSVPALYEVWLMDAYKKDSVDLRANPVYSFNISKSDATSFGASRFSLVIRQNPALGVHLLNFTAAKAADGAQVIWTTDNEQNYTNFTVERSTDNGKTFDVVGGVGSSSEGTYSLIDRTPIVAADQYRLKIEDLNGAITYSNIVTLLYSNLSNSVVKSGINVYPNPAVSTLNLAIVQNAITPSNNSNATYNITITGNNGAVVKTDNTSQTNWQGNVHNLLPGTYVIRVVSNKDKSLVGESKFVKL